MSIIDLSLSTVTRTLSFDFASVIATNVPLQLIKSHTFSKLNTSVTFLLKHAVSERELALTINSKYREESRISGRKSSLVYKLNH